MVALDYYHPVDPQTMYIKYNNYHVSNLHLIAVVIHQRIRVHHLIIIIIQHLLTHHNWIIILIIIKDVIVLTHTIYKIHLYIAILFRHSIEKDVQILHY